MREKASSMRTLIRRKLFLNQQQAVAVNTSVVSFLIEAIFGRIVSR